MTERLIKLTRGVPPVESFPTARIQECACTVLDEYGDVVLQYGKSHGFPPLRKAIAEDAEVDEARVIVGQGSLQLLDLVARMLVQPGEVVYVEAPTYDRTLTTLRRAGAEVVGIPLEDDGPDLEVLEARLAGGERPLFFYLIPDFQNPSGTVLSAAKRKRIVALAREHDFWLVEDVPYRRLRYRGESEPSLFELAPERVMQMSSFSKLISPGLRVGYIITPELLTDSLAKMAEDTYINASYFNQAIVYDFRRRGWLEPQIEGLRGLYEPRLDAMLGALEQNFSGMGSWRRPDGGFFVGLTLDGEVDTDLLLARACERRLLLTDGRGFFPGNDGNGFVRLPFCALTEAEITEGVTRLAEVVRDCEK
ncbi:MAG: PLP-dependent aminotransferase family protein [Anaerolineales bacterium]